MPSLSTPGREYVVMTHGPAGLLTCDCARFSFSSPRSGKTCGHVLVVGKADHLLAECRGAHGPRDGLCRECLVALMALSARKVRRDYVTRALLREKVAAARRRRKRKEPA